MAIAVALGCGRTEEPLHDPIWTEDSRRIDVDCGAYFLGSMRFRADRDELSAEQLRLLADLKLTTTKRRCTADGMYCKISIGQGDGRQSVVESLQLDSVCDHEKLRQVVTFESWEPFLATLPCRYAKDPAWIQRPAQPLAPHAGCLHGLFTNQDGASFDIPVVAGAPSLSHEFDLSECSSPGRAGKLSLLLFEQASQVPLASGDPVAQPGSDGTCLRLRHSFASTATHSLRVTVEPAFMPAGDFYLGFR